MAAVYLNIDIDLNKPLQIEIESLKRQLEAMSQFKAPHLIQLAAKKPVAGQPILITEAMIKALMKKWQRTKYKIDQYNDDGGAHPEEPTFTLADINKTKSDFFKRHYLKLTVFFGGLAGGLTAKALSVFVFKLVSVLSGGIFAAVCGGLAIIALGACFVMKHLEQKRLDQQQAEIAEAKPAVEAALELADKCAAKKAEINKDVDLSVVQKKQLTALIDVKANELASSLLIIDMDVAFNEVVSNFKNQLPVADQVKASANATGREIAKSSDAVSKAISDDLAELREAMKADSDNVRALSESAALKVSGSVGKTAIWSKPEEQQPTAATAAASISPNGPKS